MSTFHRISIAALGCPLLLTAVAFAETPSTAYIFPAGAQRGTAVDVRIGGHFLYEAPAFEMTGPGIEAPPTLKPIESIWFEGPVIPQPDSQRKEDYPRDYGAHIKVAANAPLGIRRWRASTHQGVTPGLKFVVGDLPEIVEQEIDGTPIPVPVQLPVTINGRIFPREDIDIWTFDAKAGQAITCEVTAARIGSPLDSRLEVRDPAGRRIAENVDHFGTDSFLRFTAPVDGVYALHIHDTRFDGLQQHVYRLTITAGPYLDSVYPLGGKRGGTLKLELLGANLGQPSADVALPAEPGEWFNYRAKVGDAFTNTLPLELADHPEQLEAEPNDEPSQGAKFTLPAVLNGRIDKPGDVDCWSFDALKDEEFHFDLRAARLGSPLDSVLSILDSEAKQLAQSDDIAAGQTDSQLAFNAPADGTYTLHVAERVASRGGASFAYRLHATRGSEPDFQLFLPVDAVSLARGAQTRIKVDVLRSPGFQEEINLEFAGLPEGITVSGNKIGKGQPAAQVNLKVEETAKLETLRLKLVGKAILGGQPQQGKKKEPNKPEEKPEVKEIVRTATLRANPGEPAVDELLLAVTVATPFKFTAPFETKFAPRGSVFVRRYKIERGGFEGPIEISLADRQNRHLQGVTGPTIVVPPGETTFDYPVTLPPWMEIGRTSRSCLMAVGIVEVDGKPHKVSYSSEQQEDQIIVLVDPVRLSVTAAESSLRAEPGAGVLLPIRVGRATGLKGPVTVELVLPRHIHGVEADKLVIPDGSENGDLAIRFADGGSGPFNMPLTIRATIADERGFPLTSETKLEIVDR